MNLGGLRRYCKANGGMRLPDADKLNFDISTERPLEARRKVNAVTVCLLVKLVREWNLLWVVSWKQPYLRSDDGRKCSIWKPFTRMYPLYAAFPPGRERYMLRARSLQRRCSRQMRARRWRSRKQGCSPKMHILSPTT